MAADQEASRGPDGQSSGMEGGVWKISVFKCLIHSHLILQQGTEVCTVKSRWGQGQ